jgi:hypothetical protein
MRAGEFCKELEGIFHCHSCIELSQSKLKPDGLKKGKRLFLWEEDVSEWNEKIFGRGYVERKTFMPPSAFWSRTASSFLSVLDARPEFMLHPCLAGIKVDRCWLA